MSPRFFPTVSNAVSGTRRALLFLQVGLGIFLALFLGSQTLLCAQRRSAQLVMPGWKACEEQVTVRRWVQGHNLVGKPVTLPDQCPAGTVYKYEPGAGQPARSPVTYYISSGPQKPPPPPPVTPNPVISVTPRPTAILVTPVPPTPMPPTPDPTSITTTPSVTPTATQSATPTPDPLTTANTTPLSPTPPPSRSVSPSVTPTTSPCSTDDPNCRDEDWPWGWIVLAFAVPLSGFGGGQVLRYMVWKKRIKVEASADGPFLAWIGPLSPLDDAIETRVKVLPGNIRFDGPIPITRREVKNDK